MRELVLADRLVLRNQRAVYADRPPAPAIGLRTGTSEAYEVVDDCRHDLAAWLDWLKQLAGPRLGLLGHSLGAVKCLYAQANQPDAAVTRLATKRRAADTWQISVPDGDYTVHIVTDSISVINNLASSGLWLMINRGQCHGP